MSLTAVTRQISPSIGRCELTYHDRSPIDLVQARLQHKAYEGCLTNLGVRVISLPEETDYPDSVFVEDAAIVFDEIAVIPVMGAPSRRGETKTVASVLSRYRPLKYLVDPATLDGGDVLHIGRRVFVGATRRTNLHGIRQFQQILQEHDYTVEPVDVNHCLHLKSACTYLGRDTILINRRLVDERAFRGFELIDVPDAETSAANALLIDDTIILPTSFPETRRMIEDRGFRVVTVNVAELQKAEAGVTCCSLLLRDASREISDG